MHTATADPLVGRKLEGRYRIVDRIARGGMSTVYSAVDERLDRLVAVKVMSSALSADPAFTDRFTREARAAARLTHLNTVSVYDQGVDHGAGGPHVFLVMELVEGRTLRDLLRERGHLDVAEAVSVMESVLSALSAAHRAGLVHRDVKPENILLSDDGVVKVADFGLARAVESDGSATRTGLMMGTVAYCAPEQLTRGQADQRSDVYAAGIVLFELLTGRPPYQGESAMNVAYQHVHSRVPAPSSRVRGIPSEIDELVIDATDPDPRERPADAGSFLARLADVRTELALPVRPVPPRPRPVAAPGDAITTRLGGPEPNDRTDFLGSAAIGAAPGYDTAVVADPRAYADARAAGPPPPIVTPPPDPNGLRRERRRRRRRRTLLAVLLVLVLGGAAGYGGWWFAAGRYSRVPNEAGVTESAAVSGLRDAGYSVSSKIGTAFSETVPPGSVINTDPGAGSRLPRGRTITLTVSKGKERFTIPPVATLSEAAARQKLETLPVAVAPDSTAQPSDTVPKGQVIGTDPAAGAQVKRGQPVTIIVSSGLPILAIPDIAANTPQQQAIDALQRAGFKTATVTAYSTTIGSGNVISISPTGSTTKFSVITLTVSKGPQMVNVPDIKAGTPLADAESALTQAGLQFSVKSFAGAGHTVIAINPTAGTQVQAGSTVVLYVI